MEARELRVRLGAEPGSAAREHLVLDARVEDLLLDLEERLLACQGMARVVYAYPVLFSGWCELLVSFELYNVYHEPSMAEGINSKARS